MCKWGKEQGKDFHLHLRQDSSSMCAPNVLMNKTCTRYYQSISCFYGTNASCSICDARPTELPGEDVSRSDSSSPKTHQRSQMVSVLQPATARPAAESLEMCTWPAGWPPPTRRSHPPPRIAALEASVRRVQTRQGSSAEETETKQERCFRLSALRRKHSKGASHFTDDAPCGPQLIRNMAQPYGNTA